MIRPKDVKIGDNFWISDNWWEVTDVGSRVFTAIKLGKDKETKHDGPPYWVEEFVIDEYDQEACFWEPEEPDPELETSIQKILTRL